MALRRLAPWLLVVVLAACAPSAAPSASQRGPSGSDQGAARSAGQGTTQPGSAGEASGEARTSAPVSRRSVKVAYPSAALSQMAYMFADEQGVYASYGVDVESVTMVTAPAIAALINGDIQYIFSGSSLLLSAAKGLPVRTFLQSSRGPTNHLFARPEIASFADLRGKTVSVLSAGGLSREVTELIIEKHGVNPKDVQYVASGSAPAQMEHLRQGLAVAATISPPWPLTARREGFHMLANIGQEIEYPFGLFATTTQRLNQDLPEVAAMTRATLETHRRMRQDAAATIAWIARRYEVDQEVATDSYQLAIEIQNDDGEVLGEGVANYFRVQEEQPELRDVRYEDIVDVRPLQAAWREMGIR
jgi:ABC-type nitrate/sulfonate/bicarbonate transport system substrate-binding protein